mgnify:CR=1 FL=1
MNEARKELISELSAWAWDTHVPEKARMLMIEAIGALSAAPPEELPTGTEIALRTAPLIKDVLADRYGRPLVAALHLCLELEKELASLRSPLGTQDK